MSEVRRSEALWIVDHGNTRVKIGLYANTGLIEVHTFARLCAAQSFLRKHHQSRSIALLRTARSEASEAWPPSWSYTPGSPAPLQVRYRSPATLGTDRLAAAVAAAAHYPGRSVLVVDAGTCITTEHVSAQGEYLGGSISPGLAMRLRAMNEFTGQLPLAPVALDAESDAVELGRDTRQALQAGAIGGAVLEVRARLTAFRHRYGLDAQLVITGGDGSHLQSFLDEDCSFHEHLVLEGLAQLYLHAQA